MLLYLKGKEKMPNKKTPEQYLEQSYESLKKTNFKNDELKNLVLSTKLMDDIFTKDNISQELKEELKDMISSGIFTPDIPLLSPKAKERLKFGDVSNSNIDLLIFLIQKEYVEPLRNNYETLKNKEFNNKELKEILLHTKLFQYVFQDTDSDENNHKLIQDHIQAKNFNPNLNLIGPRFKTAISHGHILNSRIKPFILLLENNLVDTSKMNNPDQHRATFYERYLKQGIESLCYLPQLKYISALSNLIDNIEQLDNTNIKPVFSLRNKEEMTSLFKTIVSKNEKEEKYKNDKDVIDLSRELMIPPYVIGKLIELLDKRYDKKPQLDESQIKTKETIRELENKMYAIIDKIQPNDNHNLEKSSNNKPSI